jgi:regulator of RNase E activity RraA
MPAIVIVPALALALPMVLSAQQGYSSSDAADAAERLLGRRVHMDGGLHQLAGGRMVGPAVTLVLERVSSASATAEGMKAIRVLEEAAPGTIVVACGGDPDHAIFGSTFVTLARGRRLGGFVVEGAMRGATHVRSAGLPVFAYGFVAGSAGGHYRVRAVNDTVACAGTTVAPGDLVVGDQDGVAVIPRAIAPKVVRRAAELRREKETMLRLLARHKSYVKALEEYRRSHPTAPP